MIDRIAKKELLALCDQFKAVAVIGPRQSGKTTLTRNAFPNKPYVSLENPDTRLFAQDDPRGFLSQFPDGAILDEAQKTPQLFSYLQQILDESSTTGKFIITGSNNFLLQESIVQSLAGRIAYIKLLPFSVSELKAADIIPDNVNNFLIKGGYPPIYDQNIPPYKWHQNYINTYLEKDVRQIKNIINLSLFERFLRLCAGRVGQLLNMNSLGIEVGVDSKTIASWISILESSFVVYLLKPHHRNFNKRVVKMPKLYFYDSGLAAALLGIQNESQLDTHPVKGSLFENMIVVEMLKTRFNSGLSDNLFFWRDNVGNEIDILVDEAGALYPIEIKAGKTINNDYFKGIAFWNKLTDSTGGQIIYAGNEKQLRSNKINVYPWNNTEF
ncbi:ATP-binding protein [Pedobacter endophyticus]|uniref:ATP-binding protein n=1 Tax=Pedobacter endophyticus TaxID=2789740 RepID=A0A7S9L0T4_9SPHI|nr:ATP-binding protein [Pedobacter endophyticus]QPH40362.1 ATP-binding protein [Pedobacter endophyticus]